MEQMENKCFLMQKKANPSNIFANSNKRILKEIDQPKKKPPTHLPDEYTWSQIEIVIYYH